MPLKLQTLPKIRGFRPARQPTKCDESNVRLQIVRFLLYPILGLALGVSPAIAWATTVGPVTELTATPTGFAQRKPTAAWDGTRYVIVWEDSRSPANGRELYLARIDSDGSLEDSNGLPVLVPPQPGSQSQPSIAYSSMGAAFVLSWVDPRAGLQDIYISRFFPSGSGTFPEPGGIQLTTGSDTETNTRIACADQSCMVVYQANLNGGGVTVKGMRFYPSGAPIQELNPINLVSNAGQTGEYAPRILSLGTSYMVTWEDDRNNGVGDLGSDLFVRSIPEMGSIANSSGQVMISRSLRQSAMELSRMGTNEIYSVWQDQRFGVGTSTTIDLDVWAGRFSTSNFSALSGSPAGLVTEDTNQLFPDVAAGSNRAVAVWEDFRAGTYGLTFAAVMDGNGNKLAPGDFPVFQFSANMIEQKVVKGPGDDYLAIAVRSLPGPSRIHYRIIRDEPPAGTMNATGNFQVPADGTSTAQVYFGTAQGASGFSVVDGTMYTVTLSRSVNLTAPDADPNLAGHQVVSGAAQISFGLNTTIPGTVDITVNSVEGTSNGAVTVTFDNVAPEASNVRIQPTQPRSTEDLNLLYTYFDINNDPEGQAQIQWTKNSAIQPAHANSTTVPGNALARGEVWRAQMRPFDGTEYGNFVFSNDVVVLNTPPTAVDVQIFPDTDVRTNTRLRGLYRFVDPDNDAETDTELSWTLDGVEQTSLANATEVQASSVIKGQTWTFTVSPSDGSNRGPSLTSAPVSIVNTLPTAEAGSMGEVTERRTYMLDGTGSSDIDPQDSLTYAWSVIRAPEGFVLAGTTSPTPSFDAPSVPGTTILEFGLIVSDGEGKSDQDTVIVLIRPVPDSDADGLDDEEELVYQTDPNRGDTDRDGLGDGAEVTAKTDPLDEDSDDDGVRDGAEDMSTEDTDGDNLINALDPDSDDDGLFDGTEKGISEPTAGTSTAVGNFIADADRSTTTDPLLADTDDDGLLDGIEDANHNGRIDPGESDPNDPNSTVACSDSMPCPAGLICVDLTCRRPAPPDSGMMCKSLEEIGVQCCNGANCREGDPVAAICVVSGDREVCPAGARRCELDACNGPGPQPVICAEGDDSCSSNCACTAAKTGTYQQDAPYGVLLLLGLAIGLRRRARGRHQASFDRPR